MRTQQLLPIQQNIISIKIQKIKQFVYNNNIYPTIGVNSDIKQRIHINCLIPYTYTFNVFKIQQTIYTTKLL